MMCQYLQKIADNLCHFPCFTFFMTIKNHIHSLPAIYIFAQKDFELPERLENQWKINYAGLKGTPYYGDHSTGNDIAWHLKQLANRQDPSISERALRKCFYGEGGKHPSKHIQEARKCSISFLSLLAFPPLFLLSRILSLSFLPVFLF